MSAPPKPWEQTGINSYYSGSSGLNLQSSNPISSSALPDIGIRPSPAIVPQAPPPVPQRPQTSTYNSPYNSTGFSPYNNYGSQYSPYGGGLYGSSMYGGIGGGYGYGGGYGGMNRFGGTAYPQQNSFARQAEESSRQAFQSIESIVQAFGSVSTMLESTFGAVYNSFRAVIGVADNFTRMRTQFAQIFSAFALFRTLRWLYRRLLVILRLRAAGLDDEAWNQATELANATGIEGSKSGPKRSSWPVVMFFVVVIGGPWLIWRLLSSVAGNKEPVSDWVTGNDDHFVGEAIFDFVSETDEELSFARGQRLKIAPKEVQPRVIGWLLASLDGGDKVGLVPANRVRIVEKRLGRKHLAQKKAVQPRQPKPAANTGETLHAETDSKPVLEGAFKDAVVSAGRTQSDATEFHSVILVGKSDSFVGDTSAPDIVGDFERTQNSGNDSVS